MSKNALFEKINYLILLSLVTVMQFTLSFAIKDIEVFFTRYPILTAKSDKSWGYFKLCCNDIIQYAVVKKPYFFSIAFKLILAFTIIIVISLLALAKTTHSRQQQILTEQHNSFSRLFNEQLTQTIKVPLVNNDKVTIQSVLQQLTAKEKIIGSAVYNKDKVLLTASGQDIQQYVTFPKKTLLKSDITSSIKLIFNDLKAKFINTTPNKYLVTYTTPVKYNNLIVGYISTTFDFSALEKSRLKHFKDFIFVGTLCLFMGFIAALYFSKFITKPLNDLLNASNEVIHKINGGEDKSKYKYKRQDELEVLMKSMNTLNQGLLHKDKVEAIFSQYVSKEVAIKALKELEGADKVELGGRHIMASVFFADIVGFTSLSEHLEPQEISDLLNVYFSKINDVVSFCNGHVDKFIGDCAMVVFGTLQKNDQHSFDCIACAWMVLKLLDKVNQKRQAAGEITVEFRIGVNTGMMLAGNIGSNRRMEYTVVGDSVNLASRLCGTCDPRELMMTEDVFIEQGLEDMIDTEIKDLIKLRGKEIPVNTLIVKDILTPFKSAALNEIERILAETDLEENA